MGVADRGNRFVGRSAELGLLEAAFSATASGETRTVIVGGEAGIGKTRLIESFAALARDRGAAILAGACLPLGAGTLPYQPFVAALRTLIRSTDAGRLPALLGPGRAELARLLPELGPVSGSVPAPDDLGAQARLFELVLGVVERLARDRVVLLVVEDLQWADASTRDMLAFLVGTLRQVPVLIIVSARTGIADHQAVSALLAELERDERVDRIELRPFDRAEVGALAEAIGGRQLDSDEIDRLAGRSNGNPFFVEQLIAVGREERGSLSPKLTDIFHAEIDQLTDDARAVVRVAAAAGRRLDDRLLACVLERSSAAVEPALVEVVGRGVLVQADDDGEPETSPGHAFRHQLLREWAYDELFAGERERLHRAYARCLAQTGDRAVAAELAFHWDAAHEPERAIASHVLAAHEASRMHAHVEALRHHRRVLELWDEVGDPESATGGDRARILRLGADAAVRAGDYGEAVELGRQAVAAIDASAEPARAGEASERLRWYLWEAGDRRGAEEAVRAALALLPVDPPSATRARAIAHLAGIQLFTDRWAEALDGANVAIDLATRVGDRAIEAFGLGVRALARAFLGDVDAGVVDLRAALDIAVQLDSTDGIALGYANLAGLFDRIGLSQDAWAVAIEGFEQVDARGLARTYGGLLLGHAAKALVDMGRWDEADRLTAEALGRGAPGRAGVWLLINRGRLEVRRGDLALAAQHLDAARRSDDALGGTEYRSTLLAAEAELALASDRPAAVRAIADQGIELARASGLPEPGLGWLAALSLRAEAELAEHARAHRDAAGAEEAADRAVAILGAIDDVTRRLPGAAAAGGARTTAITALCRGEASRIVAQPDPGPWAEAAEAWTSLDRPYPAAYAHFRAAEAILETRGSRDAAERAIRSAYELVARLGARPLEADVTKLARLARLDLGPVAAGGPREEPRTHDIYDLTPRELEVLRHVAGGRTNRQIAEELFISPKTVSVHVSNILGKLGVDTRVEAAAIALRLGIDAEIERPGREA